MSHDPVRRIASQQVHKVLFPSPQADDAAAAVALRYTLEVPSYTIGTSDTNLLWVRELYGQETVSRELNTSVPCAR